MTTRAAARARVAWKECETGMADLGWAIDDLFVRETNFLAVDLARQ